MTSVVAGLTGRREFCVDVEADAMHHFKASLCFVQVGTDEDIFLIDTLTVKKGLTALAPVLGDKSVTKFFHAASGDLQYLAEAGIRVQGLFDTHRAATLLGWPKVGLADLVQQYCQQTLKKEHQQSDFSIRPLPAAMRDYIADDVRYLTDIGRLVQKACRDADILEEVMLDCDRMCDEATERPDVAEDYQVKISKGNSTSYSPYLAQLIGLELHKLRLKWAEQADVPMGRMLSNAAISAISTQLPMTDRELAKMEGVRGGFVRQYGEEVLALVRKFDDMQKKGTLPQPPKKAAVDPKIRKREESLLSFRKETATERKVTPSVVMPNSLIADLAVAAPDSLEKLQAVKYFGKKRMDLYGDSVVSIMRQHA